MIGAGDSALFDGITAFQQFCPLVHTGIEENMDFALLVPAHEQGNAISVMGEYRIRFANHHGQRQWNGPLPENMALLQIVEILTGKHGNRSGGVDFRDPRIVMRGYVANGRLLTVRQHADRLHKRFARHFLKRWFGHELPSNISWRDYQSINLQAIGL